MISLLLVMFLLQLAIHLVNTVGASTINELLWILYNKAPTPTSKDAQEATRLRREVVRLKKELNATSAQDQFSTWAKLDRQHNKAVKEHEERAQSVQAAKTKFDTAVNGLRWIGTNGLRFLLQFWYSKKPLFWIPQGWLPGYVEWIMAFPRAPTGSISIQVWGIACASFIQLASEVVVALYTLAQRTKQAQLATKQPQAFKSSSAMADGQSGKKEL